MTSVPPPGLEPANDLPPPRELSEDELAANVLLSLHRLTKGATLYAADNQAAIRHLESARGAVLEYGHKTQLNPKIFFTEKSVFVGGRLLKAGRNVYNSALELGTILRQYGIDEVAIGHDVGIDDLRKFQSAVRDCLQSGGESPAKAGYERIRLRRGQAPGRRDEEVAPEEVVVRTYATATIVMRRFLQAVQKGDYRLPIGVRRIAQQLAELSAAESPAFLGTTAVYNAKHEHAGRAVNAALVALAMARQLIDDKRTLARIAMAALMFDVGIPRVAGTDVGDLRAGAILPAIIEEQHEELPASAAATMWAVGGFGDAAIFNTVLVYEALSVAYRGQAEPAYAGLREPTLAARIVAASRRFNDMLSNPSRPMNADQALCTLLREADTDVDRTIARLLASALGLFTTGSLVHLSTGDVAKVIETSDNPLLFSMPIVQPMMGRDGGGEAIDLSREEGPDAIRITALVELGEAVAQQTRTRRRHDDAEPEIGDADDGEIEIGDANLEADFEYEELPELDDFEQEFAPLEEEEPGFGDRESWSDLELADDVAEPEEPDWLKSDPPAAPAADLAPEDDFAPAPVTNPELERPFVGRVPSARKPQPLVAVRSSPPSAPREPHAQPESKPKADVDAALMAYLSEMESEARPKKAPREVLPPLTPPPLTPMPRMVRLGTPGPHTPAPHTPAPRTPLPDSPSPTPSPRTTVPKTPISVPGHELGELKPTATGTLSKTPLVHLLIYALDRKLTGTTAVVEPDGSAHLIYFDDGVASKVRTAGTVHPLDKVLRDLGAVPQRALKRSVLEIEESGKLHGQHLIEKNLIDEPTLLAALQWQLLRKVTHMLSLSPDCRYAYYDNVNALADYGGPELTPVDPLALIMTGLRMMGKSPLVSQALAKLASQPLKLRNAASVDRLRLYADELAIVDMIRDSPTTLTDLVASRPGEERTTLLTVYALMVTRSLEIGLMQKPPVAVDVTMIEERWLTIAPTSDPRVSAPPKTAPYGTLRTGAAASPPSAPPVSEPQLGEAQLDEAQLDELDFSEQQFDELDFSEQQFDELDFSEPPFSDPPEEETPPPQPAKKKRAPLELSPLSDRAGSDRAASNAPEESDDAPTAPTPRRGRIAAFGKKSTATTDEPPASSRSLSPSRLFKKAQLKLMTGKLDEAEDLVQQAVDATPEPEYIATLAWIQAEILGPPELAEGEYNDHYAAQIALIDNALARDEEYAKAIFYRAELLRMSGNREDALADYRRVADLDPHNEEAPERIAELEG